jgi:excinuclease ABC subunit A
VLRDWVEKYMELKTCPTCEGTRLRKESLWFRVDDKNISELSNQNLDKLMVWFGGIEIRLSNKQNTIAKDVLKEIRERLQFLLDVGLTYLTLNRPSRTLSGGESQRIRLATQIGSQLQGITYILDEPSIGLHQRDNQRLIEALKNLRNLGNSVLVVEMIKRSRFSRSSDRHWATRGKIGGQIVTGRSAICCWCRSETSKSLQGEKCIAATEGRRKGTGKSLN